MLRFRPTARLLVLDPADRMLLFSVGRSRWNGHISPGTDGGRSRRSRPVRLAWDA